MSFWKSLFGGGNANAEPSRGKPLQTANYNGYAISAEPMASDGKFHIAGTISKEIDGQLKEHRFLRADTFASAEEAAKYAILKAQQIIDQQGERIFRQ